MPDIKIVKQSLAFATAAAFYVAGVVAVITNMSKVLGPDDGGPVAPMIFLLLLVTSVATMATLIFGKPVMLYIDGKKREAVQMLVCTICGLAGFVALLIAFMMLARAK